MMATGLPLAIQATSVVLLLLAAAAPSAAQPNGETRLLRRVLRPCFSSKHGPSPLTGCRHTQQASVGCLAQSCGRPAVC